jgi:prepilin-type N-terminal cleavage/methylation domain-containing protein/prepilin-type processing-associated H-X9-DG protein
MNKESKKNLGITLSVSLLFPLKKKFTLIELLIVIAIIAILAAMLMPALQQAKVAGQKSSCTNNLKQIMMAIDSYTDDYNDYYPPSQLATDPWHWHRLLLKTNYFGKSNSGNANVDVYNKLMICPGDPNPKLADDNAVNDRISYGMNGNIFNYINYAKDEFDDKDHYFRRTQLAKGKMCVNRTHAAKAVAKNPSQIFTVADAKAVQIRMSSRASNTFYNDLPRYGLTARHVNSAVFAFADGHAAIAKLPATTQDNDNWKYILDVHSSTLMPK